MATSHSSIFHQEFSPQTTIRLEKSVYRATKHRNRDLKQEEKKGRSDTIIQQNRANDRENRKWNTIQYLTKMATAEEMAEEAVKWREGAEQKRRCVLERKGTLPLILNNEFLAGAFQIFEFCSLSSLSLNLSFVWLIIYPSISITCNK